MALWSVENFAAVAKQSFDLSIGEASLPLTLVEVQPLPVSPLSRDDAGAVFADFSNRFASRAAAKLYNLKNANLGRLEIFLVPVARDREGVLYQAVFN